MQSRIEFIFDEVAQKISPKKKDIASIKTILEKCELQGKSVLEVGCGIGDNLIYCVQNGADYAEGFDISGESIKLAKSKAENLPNIAFYKCSLEEFSTEKQYDFVLACGILEYLDDPVKALKKICSLLANKGTLILQTSEPIFIKRISPICRIVLSKVPRKGMVPVARLLGKLLRVFKPIFEKILYTGESSTYTIEQTILEALMVPRYNIFHSKIFSNYLRKKGFSVTFFNGATPSMICVVAKKKK